MARQLRTVFLTVSACGIVLIAVSFFNPGVAQPPKSNPIALPAPIASGRYQMRTWGLKENPYLVLLDTHTGSAWGMLLSKGEWDDLKTPPSQSGGRAEERPRP